MKILYRKLRILFLLSGFSGVCIQAINASTENDESQSAFDKDMNELLLEGLHYSPERTELLRERWENLVEEHALTEEEIEELLIWRVKEGVNETPDTELFMLAIASLSRLQKYGGEASIELMDDLIEHDNRAVRSRAHRARLAARGEDAPQFAKELIEENGELSSRDRTEIYRALILLAHQAEVGHIQRDFNFKEDINSVLLESLKERERGRSPFHVRLLDRGLLRLDGNYKQSEVRREILQEMIIVADRERDREYFQEQLSELLEHHD